MLIIGRIVNSIREVRFRYLLSNSRVKVKGSALFTAADSARISNSNISVHAGGKLTIEEGCIINNVNMDVYGEVNIGRFNIIGVNSFPKLGITVESGTLDIGEKNRLQCKIYIRFEGILTIGDHNNINQESEIRCDESVTIGDYNQISYKCVIWDTNTHNIYESEKRRMLTDKYFPAFGYEYERPKTKAITIGNDCWIGREASVLKGVTLEDGVIVGFKTVVSNCLISSNNVVVSKVENVTFTRKY
jgi:acetyltransferase-like isoleucine patch superfamily enzyme